MKSLLSKIGLIITLKNAWTTSRRVNFLWVANFNLKFGDCSPLSLDKLIISNYLENYQNIWYNSRNTFK